MFNFMPRPTALGALLAVTACANPNVPQPQLTDIRTVRSATDLSFDLKGHGFTPNGWIYVRVVNHPVPDGGPFCSSLARSLGQTIADGNGNLTLKNNHAGSLNFVRRNGDNQICKPLIIAYDSMKMTSGVYAVPAGAFFDR